MKVAQFSTPVAKLQATIHNLQRAWLEASQHWEDATSDNLQRAHLEPMLKELRGGSFESTVPLAEGMTQASVPVAGRKASSTSIDDVCLPCSYSVHKGAVSGKKSPRQADWFLTSSFI